MAFSKCVEEVLQQLSLAAKCVRPKVKLEDEFEIDIQSVDDWVEGINQLPLEEYVGVKKSIFLPEPELDDQEVTALVDSMLKLLNHFNYQAEYPQKATDRAIYSRLVKRWDEDGPFVAVGTYHIELFDYEDYEEYYKSEIS